MLRIVRNRSLVFEVTRYDTYVAAGDPGNVQTNMTGWTIRAQVRTNKGNKLVTDLNVSAPVPTSGLVRIEENRAFTKALAERNDLWFDIVGTDDSDKDHIILSPMACEIVLWPTDATS